MDPLVKQEYVVTTKYEKKIREHTTNIHLTRRLMLYIIYTPQKKLRIFFLGGIFYYSRFVITI